MIQQATPHVNKNAKAGKGQGRAEAVATNTAAADNPFAKGKAEYPGTTWRLEGELIRITIPIKFKRRGGRKQIILPDGTTVSPSGSRQAGPAKAEKPAPAAQSAIVAALARAFKWQEMLDSGEVESIAALAKRLRLEASYIRRILRLTCLAPDIIDALVDGNEPDGLSLRKLLQYRAILWTEQREELGFVA